MIGDYLGLSMNPRGQAVAGWSPTSTDEGGFRAAQFSFADGWTCPTRLAEYAFEPTALMTRSGTAVLTMNWAEPPDWAIRHPGQRWTIGGRITSNDPLDAFGHGQQMSVLYSSGRALVARFLVVR